MLTRILSTASAQASSEGRTGASKIVTDGLKLASGIWQLAAGNWLRLPLKE